MEISMKRMILVLGLTASIAVPASAQAPKPAPAPTAQQKQLIGTWEGPYVSEQAAPGSLRLVIARDSVWKLTLEVMADQALAVGEAREIKVEGTTVSWVQDIMEMTCKAEGTIVAGTLKGGTTCEQGGQVAITASWVLLKK